MASTDNLAKRVAAPLVKVLGRPVGTVAIWLLRLSNRKAGVAVIYHSVARRTGDPGQELVPAHGVDLLQAELNYLAARYRVVDARSLPLAVEQRRRGDRFPVAVTFDDDLHSHVELALPALRRAGITATFFLAGASLERPFSFWWERLQRVVDEDRDRLPELFELAGTTPPENAKKATIHELARHVQGLRAEARTAFAESLRGRHDTPETGLRADDVRELVRSGMTIGFHTRGHDLLPSLGERQLAEAFTEGRSELEEVVGARITMVGYPHGGADDRVAEAARRAGFEIGYTGRGRAVKVGDDPLLLGRIDSSYRSAGHLALQVVWALSRRHRRR